MTSVPLPTRPQLLLRPIALPTEHGGWGFLFEPIALALLVAPSWNGLMIAAAFVAGFLVRQPLKLAVQDLRRGKSYPRTFYCWSFAGGYGITAALLLTMAVSQSGAQILIPLGLVAPLAFVQILHDAAGRGRQLLPELAGATAMASSAAAIGLAGGMTQAASLILAGIIVARSLPAIVYVRTLLSRSHDKPASSWPAIALHTTALIAVARMAPGVVVPMAILFVRALWGLTHVPPAAKTIGWREVAFGLVTVVGAAAGLSFRF